MNGRPEADHCDMVKTNDDENLGALFTRIQRHNKAYTNISARKSLSLKWSRYFGLPLVVRGGGGPEERYFRKVLSRMSFTLKCVPLIK